MKHPDAFLLDKYFPPNGTATSEELARQRKLDAERERARQIAIQVAPVAVKRVVDLTQITSKPPVGPCSEVPELYGDIEGEDPAARDRRELAAKEVCNKCVNIDPCLEYAIQANETNGVWGGKNPQERKRLIRLHQQNYNSVSS